MKLKPIMAAPAKRHIWMTVPQADAKFTFQTEDGMMVRQVMIWYQQKIQRQLYRVNGAIVERSQHFLFTFVCF